MHRKKLDDVVSVKEAIQIKNMKTVTINDFEALIWAKYGCKFCEPCDRAMVCNSVIPLHDLCININDNVYIGPPKYFKVTLRPPKYRSFKTTLHVI